MKINNKEIFSMKKKKNNHIADSVDFMVYVILLSLTIIIRYKTKKVRIGLHESGLACIAGLAVGLLLKLTGTSRFVNS